MRSKQRSLIGKYFTICSTLILTSTICLGIILTVLASNYFREDKYNLLQQNVSRAAAVTMENYAAHDYRYVSSDSLQPIFSVLSNAIEADLYLLDNSGTVLMAAQTSQEVVPAAMPEEILQQLSATGEHRGVSTLGGCYEAHQYVVALPVANGEGQLVGAVLAATPAASIADLRGDILRLFMISAIVVVIISFIVIYFVTENLVRPLRQMAEATKAFAQGDFSIRVPVEGDDEIAHLASSFNSMATSLALTETTRRSFTANVSHELKTPMTTIGGFIDGILDGTIPPEMEKHYLHIVSDEVQRLSRLVRNMLTLSQIEAGEHTLTTDSVEITALVTNTLLGFEQRIEEKHIEVVGLDAERQWVLADADLIQQVVYNLVDNAVKFVNEGGTLSFDFYPEGENIMVAVRNTGDGVLPEEIPKLFDRFYKTDRSRSMDKNGVGLGLSICKTVINIHEGEIFVRSRPGEYTEFIFGLRADPSHKKGANRKAPAVDASFTTLSDKRQEEKNHERPE